MDTQSTTSTRPPPTDRPEHPELAAWRLKGFGLLRIAFGLVWAIDASFKWQPNFITHFTDYLKGALDGQPPPVQAWITFWIHIVKVD